MKVSVIMPSLNVVAYIEECITSVINQSLKEIEIICVDAGSTDGTKEILQNYARIDERISIIESDKKSYGHQVNLGLKKAIGKYISIVETDDYVEKQMLEKLYEVAESEQADFVKGGFKPFFMYDGRYCERTRKNQSVVSEKKCVINIEKESIRDKLSDIGPIWAGIYNREFLKSNCIYLNETLGASFQDTSFHMMVAINTQKCVFVEECFYHYRIDRMDASMKSKGKVGCVIDEFKYVDTYVRKYNKQDEFQLEYIARHKLEVYFWNMNRVCNESKQLFQKMISDEMRDYSSGGKYESFLSDYEKKVYEYLTNWEKYQEYKNFEKENICKIKDIISGFEQGDKYIIAGSGMYATNLLALNQVIRKNSIVNICDNSKKKQGQMMETFCILSVEEAVNKCNDEKWIVANKYYSEEIKKQLVELGVKEDKIIVISYIPEINEVLFD